MNDRTTPGEESEGHRLDKWLWHCRFYKTRSLATAAITGGKVHLNAERVKPAHRVRIADRLSLSLDGIVGEFEVLGLPRRRGPAAEAQSFYRETPESAQRRVQLREQQRLAQISRPRPDARPDKRDRRRLMRLQRDQT
jgi:ribosome-associated heat shock protein Hsp15